MEINSSGTASVICMAFLRLLELHNLVVLPTHSGKMEWKEGLTMGSREYNQRLRKRDN